MNSKLLVRSAQFALVALLLWTSFHQWREVKAALVYRDIVDSLSHIHMAAPTPEPEPVDSSDITLGISVIFVAGLILTTLMAWRRDRRETSIFDVELQKRELEIKKLQYELDVLNHREQRQQRSDGEKPRRAKESKSTIR